MIGLDANLLVRSLTRDDATQYAKVTRLIDQTVGRDERLLINSAVLCELTWVLESACQRGEPFRRIRLVSGARSGNHRRNFNTTLPILMASPSFNGIG